MNKKLVGNKSVIKNAVDMSVFGMTFTSKPLIVGGLAMEYYGIRKRGNDIDFIINNDDYKILAYKYPENRVDRWGDLYISLSQCELLRSIFRLDYEFYSEGAIEYEECMVISAEKLFFMKILAYESQPEVEKHTKDYRLMWDFFLKAFQNKEYVANAMKHEAQYVSVPDGKIFNGNYYAE